MTSLPGGAGGLNPPADQAFARACCILAGVETIPAPFVAAARIALEDKFDRQAVEDLVDAVTPPTGGVPVPPALEAIARELLTILYTGRAQAGTGPSPMPFYYAALAWQVLDFTTAPGICGFGSWSHKAGT